MKKFVSIFTLGCFLLTGQMGTCPVYAQEFRLPEPGVRVGLSPEYNPPILKGIKVHPDNSFRFDFILDQGDAMPTWGHVPVGNVSPSGLPSNEALNVKAPQGNHPNAEQLKSEASRLIKYFLASLTIPEKDLWVNLSPYEKDRIVPESFGRTEMGRDLLAEDYMLK